MNDKNIQEIFAHYTQKFEYINNKNNDERFADALYDVKVSTQNMIDSYTQPFYGLVEFARREPGRVKDMFKKLYSDDGGDLIVQEKLIKDFFDESDKLLNRYFTGSFLYKQNSHSVSAYLFLYDPDHHYMYKATQAKLFADCIGFRDEWGTGDNIDLPVFYKMCDEAAASAKQNEALISTDESRFDGRFRMKTEEMYPDKEKHMLLFDIMYCCSVYDLFDGIPFSRPKVKERKLYAERKKKAGELLNAYKKVLEQEKMLAEARDVFGDIYKPGTTVSHVRYGKGTVKSIADGRIIVDFTEGDLEKELSFFISIANKILISDDSRYDDSMEKFLPAISKADKIPGEVEYARKELEPYAEYID